MQANYQHSKQVEETPQKRITRYHGWGWSDHQAQRHSGKGRKHAALRHHRTGR